MSVYAMSVSAMVRILENDPTAVTEAESFQKLMDLSLAHTHSSVKLSSKSFQQFLRYFYRQTQRERLLRKIVSSAEINIVKSVN